MDAQNKSELESWVASRDWYQSMTLSSGLRIKGKVPTYERERFLENEHLAGKSVIDIGCNSGQFSLYAKRRGAAHVVGIDTMPERLEEARTLAAAEGLTLDIRQQSLFALPAAERYDIVFCFAVVTEIQDLFGALEVLKRTMRETLYLELDLAKPLAYLSRSFFRPSTRAGRIAGVAEVRSSHGTFVFSPSLSLLKEFFGSGYEVQYLGKSVRYNMVRIRRTA